MSGNYLRGASFLGYGPTMFVGLGIPIPVIDEEMAFFTSRSDEDFYAQVVDYSTDYPQRTGGSLGEVTYAELKSGRIHVKGKDVPTFPISSYSKAREIASTLKTWVETGSFLLTNPVEPLPGVDSGISLVTLDERTPEEMQ